MDVTLLGPLIVTIGDRPLRGRDFGGAKPRGVLEILLLSRGRSVSKDALAEALWQTSPPKNLAGTIEQYVSLLRRRLSDGTESTKGVIVTEAQAYRLDVERINVDLDRFDSLVLRAEHADITLRRRLLADAVSLAVGDLVEDAPYAPWLQWERHVYRGRISGAHMALAFDSLMIGEYPCAVRQSEAALRFTPYSEHAFLAMMIANHALGRGDLARAAYVQCCEVSMSLEVEPTTDTADIAASIAAGRPARDLIDRYVAPWSPRSQPVAPRHDGAERWRG